MNIIYGIGKLSKQWTRDYVMNRFIYAKFGFCL